MKNLTQQYVALKLKMSTANYSNIESEKTQITLLRVMKIAEILEVDYKKILYLASPEDFIFHDGSSKNGHLPYLELVKQLQIKDEQISKLSGLLEKALKNG